MSTVLKPHHCVACDQQHHDCKCDEQEAARAALAIPDVRAAMAALTATGHFDETPNSFEWLWRESLDVAAVIDDPEPLEAVMAALADTGFHDPDDPSQATCFAMDVASIVCALRPTHSAELGVVADPAAAKLNVTAHQETP